MSAMVRLNLKTSGAPAKTEGVSSSAQVQTRDAFSFKWQKRETYDSPAMQQQARNWLFERYCDNQPERLADWLTGGGKIILDAGCGSGFSGLLFFGDHLRNNDYLGVDISDAVSVARARFAESGIPGDFLQTDLLDIPVPDGSFDLIFSEGVLHHTDDTGRAIGRLAAKLKSGGRFLFYVYAKKAVIREFTDDHVREQLRTMSDEEAWEALKPLTLLGKALGDLKISLTVPENVPFLGIKQGTYDLQRFFYWNICKAYYRPEFNLDEMNHINFDWFRPLNCHRHTPEEVMEFCRCAGLEIERLNIQDAGITVVARKN